MANTANPDDCTSITQRLLIPGGAYPYFANANAAAASLALSAPTKAAKLSKRGALAFHITANANATATASGTISIRKAAKVRFAKRTVKLVAGKRATVTLRLSKKNVRGVRKALKKAKLTARITLVAKGASGGAATKRLALRLQP